MSKLVCYNSDGSFLDHFTQWDVGQSITIKGLPTTNAPSVHFGNKFNERALVVASSIENDSIVASVPNILLQYGVPIFAYLYYQQDSTSAKTLYSLTINVLPRAKPEDYEFIENIEYTNWVELTKEANELILEWKQTTEEATKNANSAAELATDSAALADEATDKATAATNSATSAASSATSAASNANAAAQEVADVISRAEIATTEAENAASNANEAAVNASKHEIQTDTGNIITVSDSAQTPLQGLRIFGKTTQDGTPTPESPVELVTAGTSGSIKLQVLGKNLISSTRFPATTTKNGVSFVNNGDGSFNISGTASVNTSFTFDWNTDDSIIACLFRRGGRFVFSCDKASYHNTTFNCTVSYRYNGNLIYIIADGNPHNVPAGAEYSNSGILIPADGTVTPLTNAHIQLEYSNVPTEYEPYTEQIFTLSTPNGLPGIPVTSDGNYTDENGQQWICDEVDFDRGTYVRRIAQYTFTGAEYFQETTYANWISLSSIGLSLGKIKAACCNWFTFSVSNINTEQTQDMFDFFYSTSDWVTPQQIRFSNSRFTTAEEFMTALRDAYAAGNPMRCLLILENATEVRLTEDELSAYAAMHTNYPNTTIVNDGGADMEVKYATPYTALPILGGRVGGNVDMADNKLTGLADPENDSDAINLRYMESVAGTKVDLDASTIYKFTLGYDAGGFYVITE